MSKKIKKKKSFLLKRLQTNQTKTFAIVLDYESALIFKIKIYVLQSEFKVHRFSIPSIINNPKQIKIGWPILQLIIVS